nr:ATP-binding cassette domain-containing protein [Burkholderiaceae bacterium]
MTLIRLQDACLAYGDAPLLDGANLVLSAGERIGLIGRNGTGKSSLLKVLVGHTMPDDGAIHRRDGLRIALVEQEPILPEAPSLRASLIARASSALPADERERWACEVRLAEQLHRFGLDGHESTQSLSGGQRKRGALALALALHADLLLLDEPTNHLDLTGIEQLERALIAKGAPSLVLITHDRAFLDQVSTRIIELDRGRLRSYPGGYSAFEARKASELQAEEKATGRFEKFWAQEEAWIRKGIEARRTRNAGRVTRLEALRSERAARRERAGTIAMKLDAGERSGKLVAELESVSKAFDERPIVADFSTRILRGDRIGLIGPNGAGKSTLIKLITGELPPDQGRIRRGTNLAIAYFDQMRAGLDLTPTLLDYLFARAPRD